MNISLGDLQKLLGEAKIAASLMESRGILSPDWLIAQRLARSIETIEWSIGKEKIDIKEAA